MKRIVASGLVMLALCLAFGGVAKADSITTTGGDVTFTGNVASTTATLTITCNTSLCNGWYLGDVTLKGFTFVTFGKTDLGSQVGFTALAGGQNNAGVGTGGGCNSTQLTSAVCWDAQNPLNSQLHTGVTYTFIADITGGSFIPGQLHVQATAYDNSAGSQVSGGKVFAISDNLLTVTTVPEPSSLVLLGVGFLGLVGLAGRKLTTS